MVLLHMACMPWRFTCCVGAPGGSVKGGMLSVDVLVGFRRGDPTEERQEAGLGASRWALGGLKARAGRSAGCPEVFAAPVKPAEPMRSSSARNVSDASMLAPKPSMDRVLRWLLPAAPQTAGVRAL